MRLFDDLYKQVQYDLQGQMDSIEARVIDHYKAALEDIEKEISDLYKKYSSDGKLYWTEMNRYNRLKVLEEKLEEKLGQALKGNDRFMEGETGALFRDSFYRHAWAIDQDAGFAYSWGSLPDDAIEAAVRSPMSKFANSKALQIARQGTVEQVRSAITVSLTRGEAYSKMAGRIGDVLGFSREGYFQDKGAAYRSLRVARTEGQRVLSEGQARCYDRAKEIGVDLEELWDATLDRGTRPAHGRMDGKKKGVDGMYNSPDVGKVAGPLMSGIADFDIHCRCRQRAQIPGYPPEKRYIRGQGEVPWINYENWNKGLNERGRFSGKVPKVDRPKTPGLNPQGPPVSQAIVNRTPKYREAANRALSLVDSVHGDGRLPQIPIKTSTASYSGAYRANRITGDSIDIRLASKEELTTIHEIGHFLDHKGLPGTSFTSSQKDGPAAKLMETIRASPEMRAIGQEFKFAKRKDYRDHCEYLLGKEEQFARAYSQWIAGKTQDRALINQVDRIKLFSRTEAGKASQWDWNNFSPISEQFDALFKEMGWLN